MLTTKSPLGTLESALPSRRRGATRVALAALLAGAFGLGAGCSADGSAPLSDEGENIGEVQQHWDAESATDETQSTHLWIVNRALDILAKHTDVQNDPKAVPTKHFLAFMESDACRSRWQQGLLDADFKHEYNNGDSDTAPGDSWLQTVASGATYKSHFYDPDTGLNYLLESSPTALTQAGSHFASSVEVLNNHDDWSTACYELGLSLHYLTDATQPMHAANFTAFMPPVNFHGEYESFVMTVQSQYVCGDWDSTCDGKVTDNLGYPVGDDALILKSAARYSKPLFYHIYANSDEAWNDPSSSAYLGPVTGLALKNAQRAAAQYIWRWFSTLYNSDIRIPPEFMSAVQTPGMSDVAGHPTWASHPSYYRSLHVVDINKDDFPDICGRLDDGIYCSFGPHENGANRAFTKVYGDDFTNARGWNAEKYGSTIQFPDINNDGYPDICGRGAAGIMCAQNQTASANHFSFGSGIIATAMSDNFSDTPFADGTSFASGEAYYGSIHYLDFDNDGKTDICGRSGGGIRCSFGPTFSSYDIDGTPDFTDAVGWSNPAYGATIQFADVDGDMKPDVCGRGVAGIWCALNTGTSFGTSSLWSIPEIDYSSGLPVVKNSFSDAAGWQPDLYRSSIRLVDVDGDGRADVCGKGESRVLCTLARKDGVQKFQSTIAIDDDFNASTGPTLADGATFQIADFDGDDLPELVGLLSAKGTGTGIWVATNELPRLPIAFDAPEQMSGTFDVGGHPKWAAHPSYYRSLHVVDINRDSFPDVCGRLDDGIYCAFGSQTGTGAMTKVYGGDFKNLSGWDAEKYGTTIQFPDINNDGYPDICGRGVAGILCALNQTSAGQFSIASSPASLVSQNFGNAPFPDGTSFASGEAYYGSIHYVDVNNDGKTDICGRSGAGIRCSFGPSFSTYDIAGTPDFSDATGWSSPAYGATIQFADIDGDQRPDVCGRGVAGIWCALNTGTSFGTSSLWSIPEIDYSSGLPVVKNSFSDAAGWQPDLYRSSIRLVDVDGDGRADVCGKGESRVLCTLARKDGFQKFDSTIAFDAGFNAATGPALDDGATFQITDVTGDHVPDLVGLLSVKGPGLWVARQH